MQRIQTQYELKDLLQIRTFDEIQLRLSERNNKGKKPVATKSQLNPNQSCISEPLNLHKDLNVALNPFVAINDQNMYLTTERRVVMDVLQMLSQPSIQSDTLVRDER
jgi:hypothetical protein